MVTFRTLIARCRTLGLAGLTWWFPSTCIQCGTFVRPYRMICAVCLERVPRVIPPWCTKCGRTVIFPGQTDTWSGLCPACVQQPLLCDSMRAWALYVSPVREWIHAMKYGRQARIATRLGEHVARAFVPWIRTQNVQAVTFVPLHRKRLRERGFNQARWLAAAMARVWKLPVYDVLHRVRYAAPQVGQPAVARWANVRAAFVLRNPDPVRRHATWLIVDDVCTTGATLDACARVLKSAGARHVHALVVALTEGSRRAIV